MGYTSSLKVNADWCCLFRHFEIISKSQGRDYFEKILITTHIEMPKVKKKTK